MFQNPPILNTDAKSVQFGAVLTQEHKSLEGMFIEDS